MSPDQQSRLASVVLATLAGAGLTSNASAADKNWVNTQPTAGWNTPSNWSPAGLPGVNDNANIINRGSQFQTINFDISDITTPTLASLVLNAEGTGDLRFVMPQNRWATLRTHTTSIGSTDWTTFRHENALHEITTMFRLGWGGSSGKATYELVGNGTTLRNFGESFIGGAGRGEFIQQGNVWHHAHLGMYISSFDQNTQNVYQMNGGSLTAGQLWVGEFGNGSFSHGAGTVSAGAKLAIAGKPSSIGYYDQWQGTSVEATVAEVGREGNGTHNQRGGNANFGQLYLGVSPAAWGTYNMGFATLTSDYTVVGVAGRGTMFNDRGLHTTGSLMISRDQGSNGSYFLAHGATLTINQDLIVGGNGTAAFNQNGGANTIGRALVVGQNPAAHGSVGLTFGTLAAQGASIGQAGAVGTVTIDGAAATFSSAMAIGTGTNGVGRLNVASGSLTTGNLSVGDGQGGAGSVHQTGGTVRANHVIYVGNATLSSGTYLMTAGTLSTPNLYVGLNGSGIFTQTGGASTVTDRFGTGSFPGATGRYNMQGGTLNVGTFENNGIFHQMGGATRATWVVGTGPISIGSGSFTTDRFNHGGRVTVSGGMLRIDDGAGSTTFGSTMTDLEVREAGRVDITDKALVVNYAPTAPSPMPALAQNVRSAYNGGAWDERGIGSSQVPAGYGVGFAPGSVGTAFSGPFAGMNFDDSSVLIAVVRFGDGNLDGTVNLADFNALAANFGQSGRGWWEGDFDYNGVVNLNDFNRLASNFGLGASGPEVTASDWAALGAAVPEPATTGLLLAASGMLRRRRRHYL